MPQLTDEKTIFFDQFILSMPDKLSFLKTPLKTLPSHPDNRPVAIPMTEVKATIPTGENPPNKAPVFSIR